MGQLGMPARPGNKKNNFYKKGNYTNDDAVENLIRYVTRTRENESRGGDLIAYGAVGAGYYLSPENIIRQFLYVQKANKIDIRKGRRMYHEVFNLCDCEVEPFYMGWEQLWHVGMDCCRIYYQMGFQAVFAIHWEQGKRYHFHFAINSISFLDGRKWHTSIPEIKQREMIFNQILVNRQRIVCQKVAPIIFLDRDKKGANENINSPIAYFDRSPLVYPASG